MIDLYTSLKSTIFIAFVLLSFSTDAQSISKQKMAELSYLTGEWVGTSNSIVSDSIVRSVTAYEKIQYSLDSTILVIDLRSETLVLHTIIRYSEQDSTYYYHPFSKNGTGKYKAHVTGNELIVTPSKEVRYVFGRDGKGNFVEYGERFIDGEWTKYFEDVFIKIE